MVKNLLAMQEMKVQSLSWEEHLEKGMATYSSILAWRIPSYMINMPKIHYQNSIIYDKHAKNTLPGVTSSQMQSRHVQDIVQLCSFHMLARYCSKYFKLGFNSM